MYEPVANSTLPGHNYRCADSSELGRCSLSVSGPREAAALCSADRRCEGYVLTNITTWTGKQSPTSQPGPVRSHQCRLLGW